MTKQFRPLSNVMGIEANGFDLRKPISKETLSEISKLFFDNHVLVFRNQNLTPEEQINFCSQFGEIEAHPLKEVPWKYREITYVANVNLEGDLFETCGPTFELWHSDTCYLEYPAIMSFLYAERVPKLHGETLFADMQKAYRELPQNIKNKIEGKNAIFGGGVKLMERCKRLGYNLMINEDDLGEDVTHPVIRTHPITKQKSIYVNWAHTDSIVGFSEAESQQLLDDIYTHCQNPAYRYVHYYQPGDLIIWDNAAVIHSNCVGKLTEPRIMRRIMIKGDKPYYSAA